MVTVVLKPLRSTGFNVLSCLTSIEEYVEEITSASTPSNVTKLPHVGNHFQKENTGSTYKTIGALYHFDASLVGAEILMDGNVITNCNVSVTANSFPIAYNCKIPPGVGGFNLTVKVASKTSNQMTIWNAVPK
ncbi:hypothetical protein ACTFIZ_009464 [Dictyostelium cf. discoideum]